MAEIREGMSPMAKDSVADKIRDFRQRLGMTMEEFAKLLGYKGASSVQRYEDPNDFHPFKFGVFPNNRFLMALRMNVVGRGSPPIAASEINAIVQGAFEHSMNKTPTENGAESAVKEKPNTTMLDQIRNLELSLEPARMPQVAERMIPLYGQAVAGEHGEIVMDGNVLGYVQSLPSLVSVKEPYALLVSGDSMEPRYFDGEVVYLDPSRRPRKGDFVVAQIFDDDGVTVLGYCKQLVQHTTEKLVLGQMNPAIELVFPAERVKSVTVVVASGMHL